MPLRSRDADRRVTESYISESFSLKKEVFSIIYEGYGRRLFYENKMLNDPPHNSSAGGGLRTDHSRTGHAALTWTEATDAGLDVKVLDQIYALFEKHVAKKRISGVIGLTGTW